jgi:hypothetical protein
MNGQIMNEQELMQLIVKSEGASLDFKRKPYSLDVIDIDIKKRQRDELIKDVLALANGNSVTVGDTSYLIIGADNKLDTTGNRKLFDVKEHKITSQRILSLVNSACEPPLQDVFCENIEIDGTTLLVITIPPSPYVHETTRELEPQSGKFNEYTVFVRHNEDNRIASAKERENLLQLKSFHFNERKNPPAMLFGLLVGGISGGSLAYSIRKGNIEKFTASTVGIAGMVTGGLIGLTIGSVYKNIYEIRSDWDKTPPALRIPLIGFSLIAGLGLSKTISWLLSRKKTYR